MELPAATESSVSAVLGGKISEFGFKDALRYAINYEFFINIDFLVDFAR